MTQTSLPRLGAVRLARMVEISRVLNSTTNLDDLLAFIIREAADLTTAEAASILLLDPHTRQLHFKASSNQVEPQIADIPLPLDTSIAGAVLKDNHPLIINDVSSDPRWNPVIDRQIHFHTRSILGVPMHDKDRQPIGVLESLNKRDGAFTADDVETLATLADLAGVAVEKARLIQELQRAYEELNELDQLKSDFISVASHELRTPLSVILGYVSFLREEAAPEMAEQLGNVLEAAVRLRSLIQDMLNLQYVDAGQAALQLEQVDLVELVRGVTGEMAETALAKNHDLTLTLPVRSIPVTVDTHMMEIVLNNVLDNAIKFTEPGGQIKVTVMQQGQEAWLCVSDNGIGIPAEKLDRIFKHFYQLETALRRQHEGIGLGLAIAKELVDLHHGRLWAESQLNQGSQFFVALQLSQEA